jgi:hypothetical protein
MMELLGVSIISCVPFVWNTSLGRRIQLSHPILCDNGLGNMYKLRENMANSTGE